MEIHTSSARLRHSREGILEFLLVIGFNERCLEQLQEKELMDGYINLFEKSDKPMSSEDKELIYHFMALLKNLDFNDKELPQRDNPNGFFPSSKGYFIASFLKKKAEKNPVTREDPVPELADSMDVIKGEESMKEGAEDADRWAEGALQGAEDAERGALGAMESSIKANAEGAEDADRGAQDAEDAERGADLAKKIGEDADRGADLAEDIAVNAERGAQGAADAERGSELTSQGAADAEKGAEGSENLEKSVELAGDIAESSSQAVSAADFFSMDVLLFLVENMCIMVITAIVTVVLAAAIHYFYFLLSSKGKKKNNP